MWDFVGILGIVAVAIVVVLIIVIIRLIGAIFEIRDYTKETAEHLDEVCKRLEDMPKNYTLSAIRDEISEITKHNNQQP